MSLLDHWENQEKDLVRDVLTTGQKVGPKALNQAQQVVYFVIELETIISMESLLGFYDCAVGGFAQETVIALEKIGSSESAALLRRANAFFPGGGPPTNLEERRKLLWDLEEKTLKAIDALGDQFLQYPDDLDNKLGRFIEEHRVEISQELPARTRHFE